MKEDQKWDNNSEALIQAGTVTRFHNISPKGFYQKLFFFALRNCKTGILQIELPDKKIYVLGNKSGSLNAKMVIKNLQFFKHTILYGEIGFGEAYVEKWWDSPDTLSVLKWFTRNAENVPTFSTALVQGAFVNFLGFLNKIKHLFRPNTKRISRRNISEHYDLGNDLYKLMLDDTMAYSAGIYKNKRDTLKQAQLNKYERLCRKLELRPADHLLEIGSGWGGFAIYAAHKFGCRITTVTISQKQFELAQKRIRQAGLEDKITIKLQDYRELKGTYDKIVSIEMIEAIGFRYTDTFFRKVAQLLKADGLAVLQYITYPESDYEKYLKQTDWTQIYIFPGSCLISNLEIMKSLHRTGKLLLQDLETMGLHYARTLSDWRHNFNASEVKVKALGFDEKFIRKWNYYLLFCEAGFSEKYISDVQITLSRAKNLSAGNFYDNQNLKPQ